MIFRNQRSHGLNFELDGVRYLVEPSGKVEIPDRVAYCVALYGLPLSEATAEPAVEPVVEPADSKPSRKKN